MIVYPDYGKSLLNIIGSIQSYYGISHRYEPLKPLTEAFEKKPQKVLLLILDGMGMNVLCKLLPKECFLRSHVVTTLTSVFPPTTTAAMTSYYSGTSPLEHGWLGWSLYFKEFARQTDTFLNLDSYTRDRVGKKNAAYEAMPYTTIFPAIANSRHFPSTFTILPKQIHISGAPNTTLPCESSDDFYDKIMTALSFPGESFIMGYWPEPDATMHKSGCYAVTTRKILLQLDQIMASIAAGAPEDTLIIISADHGLTDIDKTLYLNDFPELMSCLIMPPFLEPRCLSFFVKHHKKELFEKSFNRSFKEDFLLLSREDFLNQGYLGKGRMHPKTDDFIGDYIAIAIGHKLLKYKTLNLHSDPPFKAHHAGLRREEMIIPLILFQK